jgi:pimeloyl-ACP methyl ester carboxylesterase
MPNDIRAGQPTHWQSLGAGPRPAIAVHCMLASGSYWAPIAAEIPEITLTAFDLPGQGRSGVYDGTEDYQKLATQILASFISHPVDLVGHSFGATVALRLAVAAPAAVRSLTLIEPVLFAAARGTPEWAAELAEHALLHDLGASGRLHEAAQRFVGRWGATPWDSLPPAHQDAMAERMALVDASADASMDDNGRILRPDGLEAIDAPVMLIEGADSPAIVHRINEALAARLADVGTARIPGAGHMAPMTHVRQVADLIALNLERA